MTSVRTAGAAALFASALFAGWAKSAAADAQEFRSLLSADLSTVLNRYQGSTILGNTVTRQSRFRNISGTPFVIDGVRAIYSLDPEDLGHANLTLENVESAKAAMGVLYPNTDLFAWTLWLGIDQPRRLWTTEITFDRPFPILVDLGEEFAYTRVSRNDRMGPNFGPVTAPLPISQTNAIGEIIIAFDFDWHYVPEPGSGLLAMIGVAGLWWRRRAS